MSNSEKLSTVELLEWLDEVYKDFSKWGLLEKMKIIRAIRELIQDAEGGGEKCDAWQFGRCVHPAVCHETENVKPQDEQGEDCACECVKWNPFNKVVQCHRCGRQPKPELEIAEEQYMAIVMDLYDRIEELEAEGRVEKQKAWVTGEGGSSNISDNPEKYGPCANLPKPDTDIKMQPKPDLEISEEQYMASVMDLYDRIEELEVKQGVSQCAWCGREYQQHADNTTSPINAGNTTSRARVKE